jgi:hypothetical protein
VADCRERAFGATLVVWTTSMQHQQDTQMDVDQVGTLTGYIKVRDGRGSIGENQALFRNEQRPAKLISRMTGNRKPSLYEDYLDAVRTLRRSCEIHGGGGQWCEEHEKRGARKR